MTSTLRQSLALDRIIAAWTAIIAAFFCVIVATIVANVGNVRHTLHELGACCRKDGRLPGLSRPMMPKLETSGHYATPFRAEPSAPELNDAEASGDDSEERLHGISKSLRGKIWKASGRHAPT